MTFSSNQDTSRDPQKICEKLPSDPIVGIDLGTTNSCCSIVKNGRPFIIPSRRGYNTIPSVVAINARGEIVVGHAARAQMEINPSKTIYGSKRLVGRPFESPVVREVRDRFHYKIVPGPDRLAAVQIDDRILSLEEVSALILGELRDVAQDYLGVPLSRAVITVPAYYNENQRQAVRRAGALANLKVEKILNEPTAAAIAYGHTRGKSQRVLVYDLGGGTFDVSVLDIGDNRYEVLATGGDTFLGGVDFDMQLLDYIIIEFQLQLGRLPQMERSSLLRVLQAAEHVKRTLSDAKESQVRLPFIGTIDGKPIDLDLAVPRQKLEELVIPLVGRTLEVCDRVLESGGLQTKDLDAVLLVGGQTRMPLAWRMIAGHLGKQPHKGVNPDEAVAQGAALMAAALCESDILELVDVLPVSIGLGLPGGVMRPILPAGMRAKTSKTYTFKIPIPDLSTLSIPFFQGENPKVDDNEYLGMIHIPNIPPGTSKGRSIDITFGLDTDCLLTVTARDNQSGNLEGVALISNESTLEKSQ